MGRRDSGSTNLRRTVGSERSLLRRLVDYGCIVLLRIMLDWAYLTYAAPRFSYQYHFVSNQNYEALLLSWLVLIASIPFAFRYDERNRCTSMLVTVLYCISFVPGTMMIAYGSVSWGYTICYLIFWATMLYACYFVPQVRIGYSSGRLSNAMTVTATAVLAFSVIYVSWKYTGFRFTVSLANVYDLRLEAREFDLPWPLSYLFYAAKIAIPVLVAHYLSRKRYLIALLLGIVQLLAFSADGTKSTLFTLVIVVACYYFVKRVTISLIIRAVTLIVLTALIEYIVFDSDYILNYGIRRLFYVPASLNVDYYQFFSSNDLDFYRQSIFSKLGFESPYVQSIGRTIGLYCLGSPVMNANNGLFSDAYANLGIVGCFVVPLMLVTIFRIIDIVASGLPFPIVACVLVITAYTFISSSFFTVLISHGLFLVCIILYFLPRSEIQGDLGE